MKVQRTDHRDGLLHVGICRDGKWVGYAKFQWNGKYLITAQYMGGYDILGRFENLELAEAALPLVKRRFRKNASR